MNVKVNLLTQKNQYVFVITVLFYITNVMEVSGGFFVPEEGVVNLDRTNCIGDS